MLGIGEQDAACARVDANRNEQLLNLNQAEVDQLEIDAISDDFIQGSEHHLCLLGKFT